MSGHYIPLLNTVFVIYIFFIFLFFIYLFIFFFFKFYAGAAEFSFEELRAIEYLKGNRPARCKQGRKMKPAIIPFIVQHNVVSFVSISFSI